MNQTRYPLQWPAGWPRSKSPVRSSFGHKGNGYTIDQATQMLSGEIKRLTGGKDFILSTNLKYRNDGLPYSQQREPDDKGVAVYFNMADSMGGRDRLMTIACDTYRNISCNIYAIAKTIEALRGIQRWGCSELMNRAFTGFQALPESTSASALTTWWGVLGISSDASENEIKSKFRELSKIYHPDVPGGNAEKFIQVRAAYEEAMAQFQTA